MKNHSADSLRESKQRHFAGWYPPRTQQQHKRCCGGFQTFSRHHEFLLLAVAWLISHLSFQSRRRGRQWLFGICSDASQKSVVSFQDGVLLAKGSPLEVAMGHDFRFESQRSVRISLMASNIRISTITYIQCSSCVERVCTGISSAGKAREGQQAPRNWHRLKELDSMTPLNSWKPT